MNATLLEAIDVTKVFDGGVRAVDHVDLEVRAGETLVLIGESGSGKSTLLRMFNRLEEPSTGTIRVRGRAISEHDPIDLRRHTGYVQQEGGLLPHWTVGDNVALVPRLLGWDAERRRRRTATLLELVGLAPEVYSNRYPRELSGGQRQRVAVARALAADPEVILLDEPFGALDAITRVDLQNEFLALSERLHKTMVLVTHDLDEAFRLGDRIAVLREGALVQVATPREMAAQPANEYVVSLLAHRRGGKQAER
jgi:osmoprotectant transport system ATP-binding protein